jgi:hypothetical protein
VTMQTIEMPYSKFGKPANVNSESSFFLGGQRVIEERN